MSSTMLSASLPSVDAYDAFTLSPMTVVARVLASQSTSASRISSTTTSSVFAASNATCVMMLGSRKYESALVATRERIVKSLLGEIVLLS